MTFRRLRGAPRRRRKFPRILLAITADDERRLAMLQLTKERFIVDECAVGSDVLRMWEHPYKYDAVLVLLDEELDPTCPLVVSDIRRCELDKDAQQRAEKSATLVARLGEAEVEQVAAHRAQRFAERQRQKQDLLDMQVAVSAPMPLVGARILPASSLVLQTVIVGFCDLGNATKQRAMANSGNYDFVVTGKPSDALNAEWLVGQLRAEYELPVLDSVPTFQDVVANLKAFRDDVALSETQHSAMERGSMNPSPHSERWKHSGARTGSAAHGLDTSSTVLSLERQIREAKGKIEELAAARDATELDLSSTQRENQRLRAELEDIKGKYAVANDLRCSFEERYESRVVELCELRKEVDVQMRQLRGGPQHGQQLNADVQHLVAQNNRLRDTAFAFETALHEATVQCKILQRKVDRGFADKRQSAATRFSSAGGVRRHQSLARLALPAADELFNHDREEVETQDDVKFGEELQSESSASDGETDLLQQRKPTTRRLPGASFVKKSTRNLHAHRGHGSSSHALALAFSTLATQEAALMAFHDAESAEREFFDGCKSWMGGDGARRRVALQHAMHPAMGHGTLNFEHGTLLQAWGAVEQEFRSSNALRRELQSSTPVELVFRHAEGSQLDAMRTFLADDGLSSLSAEDLLQNLNQTCGPLAKLMDRSSSSYRRVFTDMLSEQLRLYDKFAMRLPNLVESSHFESAMSVLNLLTVQTCAVVKAAVVTFSTLERQNEKAMKDVIVAATVSFAQVVNPMKHTLQRAADRGELRRLFDFATQTDVAILGKRDGLSPRPPRTKM